MRSERLTDRCWSTDRNWSRGVGEGQEQKRVLRQRRLAGPAWLGGSRPACAQSCSLVAAPQPGRLPVRWPAAHLPAQARPLLALAGPPAARQGHLPHGRRSAWRAGAGCHYPRQDCGRAGIDWEAAPPAGHAWQLPPVAQAQLQCGMALAWPTGRSFAGLGCGRHRQRGERLLQGLNRHVRAGGGAAAAAVAA